MAIKIVKHLPFLIHFANGFIMNNMSKYMKENPEIR